jgi:multiple antibiotic resistance protein
LAAEFLRFLTSAKAVRGGPTPSSNLSLSGSFLIEARKSRMERELVYGGKEVLLVIGALLPIVNPFGNAPIFLAMTSWASTDVRRALAWRIAANAFTLLIVSIFIGSHILTIFGISLPVVQIGGGLLVAASGWRLLDVRAEPSVPVEKTSWTSDEVIERAFFPLTFPLTVGPGSISVAIALGANTIRKHPEIWVLVSVVFIATALIAASIYYCYRFADTMPRLLGENGTRIFLRLSAFILLCIGIQIVWNGASALITSLPRVT